MDIDLSKFKSLPIFMILQLLWGKNIKLVDISPLSELQVNKIEKKGISLYRQ